MRLQQQAAQPQQQPPMGQAPQRAQPDLQQQMEQQRQAYERQLYEQAQMLQVMVQEKETLGSKLKKVYERTAERMTSEDSKQELSELFHQVLQEDERADEQPERQSSSFAATNRD